MPKGFEQLFKALDNYPKTMQNNMDKALHKSAEIVRTKVIKGINSQKWVNSWPALSSQYLEKKEERGDNLNILISGHRAPGSKNPIGNYVHSFAVEKVSPLAYAIGSNHPQAGALEYGWEINGLPARPHLKPALEESIELIKNTLGKAFQASLSGGNR